MPQFFLNKRLIILLVSIIILVALIGFSLRDREQLTWPEQFLKDTTGFVQQVLAKPTGVVTGFFEDVKGLINTYEENKELKKRLDELAQLEVNVQLLAKENAELRDILDKEDTLRDFKPIQATVIARNADRWEELLIINKGKTNGIEKNMAVVTANGLIGKVKSTQQFTATVQLLSAMDPTNRISAEILRGEDESIYGTIEGYDEKRELLKLKRIPNDAEVKKGQLVVTSGMGGIFPAGLPIGEVVDVEPDEFGLNQTAYVKPGANLYDIKDVIVVEREMIQPETKDAEEEEEE